MPADAPSSLYEQLAEKYHAKGKFPERDRFLILAADAAWNGGQPDQAETFRRRILEFNPNHLLRPYASFADALKSADILAYVQQLRRGYPRDRALELLKELDLDPRLKPKAEDSDFGYAPSEPAKAPPLPFKLADEKKKPEPAKANPGRGPAPPPPLTQSQSLHGDAGKMPRSGPAPQPAWQNQKPAVPARAEEAPGSFVGAFLSILVSVAALATVGYIFVWPLVK